MGMRGREQGREAEGERGRDRGRERHRRTHTEKQAMGQTVTHRQPFRDGERQRCSKRDRKAERQRPERDTDLRETEAVGETEWVKREAET